MFDFLSEVTVAIIPEQGGAYLQILLARSALPIFLKASQRVLLMALLIAT
jgi:hypothetical protein